VIVEQFMNRDKAFEIVNEGLKLYQEKKDLLLNQY
jgi:hypothetical protein